MQPEIEVWYLLPALRRELTNIFIKEYGLSQKDVADILGVTEASISHYLSYKRAAEINFSKKDKEKIRGYAERILKDKKNFMKYFYELSSFLKKPEIICRIHKSKDKSISKSCKVCFK